MSDTNNSLALSIFLFHKKKDQEELKIYKKKFFNSLIYHFNNYPFKGFKLYIFNIWCEIVKLLENKELTAEILDNINDLKNKLNKWN